MEYLRVCHQVLDGYFLGGEVAGDHQRWRCQLGLELQLADCEVSLLFGLLLLVLDDHARLDGFLSALA